MSSKKTYTPDEVKSMRKPLTQPEFWCLICGWSNDEPCTEFHSAAEIAEMEMAVREGEDRLAEWQIDGGNR